MKVERFVVSAFEENTYLLSDPASGDAVFIDPGDEGDALAEAARTSGVKLRAIWLTHAHVDHIGGIAGIRRHFDVPVFLHPADRPIYDRGADVAQMYGVPFEAPPAPDRELAEGDRMRLGALEFDVLHVPGHAPGHVAFVGGGVAFVGDCLFAGSIGRSDLPLADPALLEQSLVRLAALPRETRVLPGHGPDTTIGRERDTNPFLVGLEQR